MLFEISFYKKDVNLTEIVINQGYFSVSKKSSVPEKLYGMKGYLCRKG